MGNVELQFRPRPLCACLSAALLLATPGASAALPVSTSALSLALARAYAGSLASALPSSVVTDCGDLPGVETLRYHVTHAAPGETIDISGCNSITLTSAILVPGVPMTVAGPGIVYAAATNPAFASASPELTLSHVTVFGGFTPAYLGGKGGAIYAIGNLTLQNSTVNGGIAGGNNGRGGSIYTTGDVTLQDSIVTGGKVAKKGGCIYAQGSVVLDHSSVTGCSANAYGDSYYEQDIVASGGAIAAGSVTLRNASQVTDSLANGSKTCQYSYYYHDYFCFDAGNFAGGIVAANFTCSDSTVSGNNAQYSAGIRADSAWLTRCTVSSNFRYVVPPSGYGSRYGSGLSFTTFAEVLDSTVAWNGIGIEGAGNLILAASTVTFNCFGGVFAGAGISADSSIIALNQPQNYIPDCYGHADAAGSQLIGADNLIIVAAMNQAPAAGVITVTADPQLLPIADNGGPTLTFALSPTSPALNKGNNAAHLATDQRGAGFVRSYGRQDIGAFEVQVEGDAIFYDGFDETRA